MRIGKDIRAQGSHGQFIGLAKFSRKGAEILKSECGPLCQEFGNNLQRPFQNAAQFRKAYLTDMVQELIDRGYNVVSVGIRAYSIAYTASHLGRLLFGLIILSVRRLELFGE